MSPALPPEPGTRREAGLRFLANTWVEQAPYSIHASPTEDFERSRSSSPEVFSATIILDLLQGRGLDSQVSAGLVRFLQGQLGQDGLFCMFTNRSVPPDVDCTGLALSVLHRGGDVKPELAGRAADRIVTNTLPNGLIQVYLDCPEERRGRLDAAVCANALYLLYQLGRGSEARASEDFVLSVLERPELELFLQEAPYYSSVDVFLYFVARLAFAFPEALGDRFHAPLRRRLRERQGRAEGPLGLALQMISAGWAGLPPGDAAARLASFQREDGAWPKDVFFKYGSAANGTVRYLGSEALTTAFALRALG